VSDPARDTVSRRSVTLNLPTDKLGLPEEAGAGGCEVGVLAGVELAGCDADVLLAPRLEKFHFSPFSDFTMADFRLVQREMGHVQRLRENQRDQFLRRL